MNYLYNAFLSLLTRGKWPQRTVRYAGQPSDLASLATGNTARATARTISVTIIVIIVIITNTYDKN